MRITAVRPSWLCARIPADRAHVSDFGRNDAFHTCLIEIEGHVLAPTRPGLGLTLRRDRVREITVPV